MLKMYLSYINLIYFISISLNFIVFDQILQNLSVFLCKKVSVLFKFICRGGDKYGKILLIT